MRMKIENEFSKNQLCSNDIKGNESEENSNDSIDAEEIHIYNRQ